jgi:hypothetical protein
MPPEYFATAKQRWTMIAALGLTSAITVYLLVAEDINTNESVESAGQLGVTIDINYTFVRMKWRIALFLIIAVLALLPRKKGWFFISWGALVLLVSEYVWWYVRSLRGLAEAGVDHVEPSIGNLYLATWADIGVLAIVLLVLSWQLWLLVRFFGKLKRIGASSGSP